MRKLIAFTAGALFASHALAVDLVRDGKPVARIYVAGGVLDEKGLAAKVVDPEARARTLAVNDLNYHLQQMSGAQLEVVATDDPAAVKGPAVVIGALAVKLGAEPQQKTESREGFRLIAKGDRLLIGGQSEAGAALGVYDLLERLGCDWVMPGKVGEVIPKRATVTVADVDVSDAPDFLFRRLWYRGYPQPRLPEEQARMEQWLRRQKGGDWTSPLAGAGGHVWDAFIKRHKEAFDKDPTMLALRRAPDGTMKRMGPQLETTHPRVIGLFVQEIKDAYAKNIAAGKWTKDTVAAFGVGPADGLGYSMSAEALSAGAGRIDPIVGELDRTDEMVLFCNRILAEVHKEYPNAYVGYYSYSTHADFPMRHKPDPKIVQIFAPINFSRLHSLLDENSKTQAYYKGVVEQWGRLSREQGNPLIYRGYNWNLAENMLPYSKVRIWGEELPFYKQQGVLGLNVEATKAWAVNGPSDFVFMKLAWDTQRPWREVLHDYCVKAFGDGAGAMERYLTKVADTQKNAGMEAGSYHAYPLIYDAKWVADAKRDLDAAASTAKTPEQKARIGYFADGLEALRLFLAFNDAIKRHDFAAVKAGYDALQAQWKKSYDQNTDTVANETPAYLKRFYEKFVNEGVKHSSEPYRMVYKIPDELVTYFDPNQVGHEMRLQSPAINDSHAIKTQTFGSTWDAQGLAGIRSGAVWYRVRFTLPPEVKDQPVGLFVGGVEDEARVWINGQSIGTSGRGFSVPSVFDLTDGLKGDGENVLAIEVVRNSMANEIGLGGIIRPCYLFTGPRLETKAPKPVKLQRVLPGGELGGAEE